MTRFAIAGIQMRVSATEDNVATMRHRLATLMAIYPWVRMVVFSELAVSGPLPQAAQPIPGPAEEALQAMAAKHDLWLVSGSMYESSRGHVYNTASVIDPDGEVVGRYRKMFPFEPYELGISAGDEFLVFDVPDVGRFGLYICYDMWIPETSRTLAVMGAEVILRPTLTGTIDRDVELSIARATAVTNQCFVFDINGVGDGGNGRSIICGPEGSVLYPAHLPYNVTLLDREGAFSTVQVCPGRDAAVTDSPVGTNHQQRVGSEDYARMSSTVERQKFLASRLADVNETRSTFIERFLHPPLHNTRYEHAFGTLYTAAYYPRDLAAEYRWPRQATLRQSFSDFEEEETMIHLKPLRASFKTRTVS